jgi:hypothetical protein
MRRNVRRALRARPLRPVMRPLVRRIVSRRPRIRVDIAGPPEWERQVREELGLPRRTERSSLRSKKDAE